MLTPFQAEQAERRRVEERERAFARSLTPEHYPEYEGTDADPSIYVSDYEAPEPELTFIDDFAMWKDEL